MTNAYEPPDADMVTGWEIFTPENAPSGWQPGPIIKALPENMTRYVSNGAVASVPQEELAFYFSGLRAEDWGPTTLATRNWSLAETLIEVDMADMRSETWSNYTLPDQVLPRADAQLEWIPVGGQGILMAIGGVISDLELSRSDLSDSELADVEEQTSIFTQSLPLYDIASQTWYIQNTTGNGPGSLAETCSVMAPAQDHSSFNIYFYGGFSGLDPQDPSYDNVWILSLPSFTWIKAYTGDAGHARRGHRCEKVYPDQMFIIGGKKNDPSICVEGGVIQVFNLNTLEFQDVYDPEEWSEYEVPDVVVEAIGGDGEGGATKTASFSSTALASIFEMPYPRPSETYYPYSPRSEESPGPDPSPPVVHNDGLADWVAPVLGVVLTLIVLSILAILFLLWRRRRLLRRNSADGSRMSSSHHNNRIFNWVNGMPTPTTQSEGKTQGSVTSNDIGSDPSVSTPRGNVTESGGQAVCEAEAEVPESAPAEMAGSFPFQDGSPDLRRTDFAYPTAVSSRSPEPSGAGGGDGGGSSGGGDVAASTKPGSKSVLSSIARAVDPHGSVSPPWRSRHPSTAMFGHHRHRSASIDTTLNSEASARSPGPDFKSSGMPPRSPSPLSEESSAPSTLPASPAPGDNLVSATTSLTGTNETAAPGRGGHHRQMSSLSGDLHSPSSLESLVDIQEATPAAATSNNNGETVAEHADQKTDNLKRQQTAGKKSSFGELFHHKADT